MARNRFMAAYLLGASFLPSAMYANELPNDPNVIAGAVAFANPSARQLLIQQSSSFGIVDWGGFSIAQSFGVQVNNGAGATLNRVTGGDVSAIMGSLNATGSVFLINPAGIVVGKTGVVNTGGRFVATTLDVTNDDFLAGGDTNFAGDSAAAVINLGQVASMGGDVALIARHVVNDGTLSAPNGTVGEVAGREVLMRDAAVDDGMFVVKVGGTDTSVSDSGAIRAAAAELRANGGNVLALAGNTAGTIEATGVAKVAGRVFLTADNGTLKVTKTVKAHNADGSGGAIVAHATTVDLAGTLDASGTKGGSVVVTGTHTTFDGQIYATGGGFVEVSGDDLTFAGDVQTDGGTLLIDPRNLEIDSSNSVLLLNATIITPAAVERLLGTQNVILQTTGSATESGTIFVDDAVTWNSNFSLSLLAHGGDIWFRSSVQNNSDTGGDLNVVAGWNGGTGRTVFDPAPFDAAILGSQTLFGRVTDRPYTLVGTTTVTNKSSGSVFVGYDFNNFGAAVGAKTGATRVYAQNVFVQGATTSRSGGGFAQLGYNVSGAGDFGTISGDISVRAVNQVLVSGGNQFHTAGQIGHIGINAGDVSAPATALATGSISIEAGGNLFVIGGTTTAESAAFALIGNGSRDLFSILYSGGNVAGAITAQVGGQLVINQNDGFTTDAAFIGDIGRSATGAGSDLTLTAATFFKSDEVDPSIDVNMLARDTAFGDVRVTTTNSALRLTGTTALITCECNSIATLGSLIVQTSGDLTMGTASAADFRYSNTGGGNLVLASGGNVINNAGAAAIGTMAGQWLIYSDRPDHDSGLLGVLIPTELFFQLPYDPADPLAQVPLQVTGNAFAYRQAPVIVVSGATITYGDTYAPGTISMTVAGTGEVIADPATWGFTLSTPFVDSAVVAVSADGFVNAGTYASAIKTNVSTSVASFVTSYFLGYGTLVVDPALITVALTDQTKTYDGVGLYTGTVNYSGFKGTDSASLITTGPGFAYAGGDNSGVNAGTYRVSASGAVISSSNYILDETGTAQLVIDPKTLSAAIVGLPTKVYDGTTSATLTAANFLLTGFVSGEGATVSQTVGTYAGSDANVSVGVSATLAASDFAALGTTLLANYVLPTTAVGTGAIDRRSLAVNIVGNPTKTYDGSDLATLTPANFQLSGFAIGEGASITQTAGTYATANAALSDLITATLSASDFAPTGAFQVANYALPLTATGNGVINPAELSAGIRVVCTVHSTSCGTFGKVFDGTNLASVNTENFFYLDGLVAGDSIGYAPPGFEAAGTLDSPNASSNATLTALLAPTYFVARGATLLSNYVLPSQFVTQGVVFQRSLTATIVGDPTKLFDGTTTAFLNANNYALSGFVAGQGATVTQTVGAYDSPAEGSRLVTAGLSAADFSASSGTLLSNYILPTIAEGVTVAGAGQIGFTPTLVVPVRGLADSGFSTTPLGFSDGPSDGLQTIDTETTRQILDQITAGANFCREFVQQEYAIDCLSDRLQATADGLSSTGEYSEVRAALEDAARKLHAIALNNESSVLSQKVARSTTGPSRTSSRPLVAVSQASLASANAQATAIIVNTQLVLLRSAGNSEKRRVAFEQVGQILGTTKVLLRSS